MSVRNRTYRPAAQTTAAARPSPDGGWRVVFPPTVGTHNPRSRETTRVTPFAHLHIGSFANSLKFTFSAKERDTETGLSYFGARYYSSDLSIWLSVDPMSGKYPSLSPYVYCANNPVKLVDPNGETYGSPGDPPNWKEFTKGALAAASGFGEVVGGVALCATGGGAGLGATLIIAGIPSIGLGAGKMCDAVKTGGENNVPGGLGESCGLVVDEFAKNKNVSAAKAGSFLDAVMGGACECPVSIGVTVAQISMFAFETNESKEQSPSNSGNEKSNNKTNTNNGSMPKGKCPLLITDGGKDQKFKLKANADEHMTNVIKWTQQKQ